MPKIGPVVVQKSQPVAVVERDILEPYWQNDRCILYQGDNLPIMESLPSQSVHLAFCDPPFNIDHEYDQYDDNRHSQDYLGWLRVRFEELRRLMRSDGSVYVAIGAKYQAEVKILLDECGYKWKDSIVNFFSFGATQQTKFTPSWVMIHQYVITKKYHTWNGASIRVPSSRQLRYNDKRAQAAGKLPNNVWILLPEDYPELLTEDKNFIMASRICGTFKERTPHKAQMPEAVLERIIKVSSNVGDVVFDPFLGSGTTAAVALKLKRKAIGIELSENYVKDICVPRLKGL